MPGHRRTEGHDQDPRWRVRIATDDAGDRTLIAELRLAPPSRFEIRMLGVEPVAGRPDRVRLTADTQLVLRAEHLAAPEVAMDAFEQLRRRVVAGADAGPTRRRHRRTRGHA